MTSLLKQLVVAGMAVMSLTPATASPGCLDYVTDPAGDTTDPNPVVAASDSLDLLGMAVVQEDGVSTLRIRLGDMAPPSDPLVTGYQIDSFLLWSNGGLAISAIHASDGGWEIRGHDDSTEEDRTLLRYPAAPADELWIALPAHWLRAASYQGRVQTGVLLGVEEAGVTVVPLTPGAPRAGSETSDRLPDGGGTAELSVQVC